MPQAGTGERLLEEPIQLPRIRSRSTSRRGRRVNPSTSMARMVRCTGSPSMTARYPDVEIIA